MGHTVDINLRAALTDNVSHRLSDIKKAVSSLGGEYGKGSLASPSSSSPASAPSPAPLLPVWQERQKKEFEKSVKASKELSNSFLNLSKVIQQPISLLPMLQSSLLKFAGKLNESRLDSAGGEEAVGGGGGLGGMLPKGLMKAAGVLSLAAMGAKLADGGMQRYNQSVAAEGSRLANLQTTGNAAAARHDEWLNSLGGIIVSKIPIWSQIAQMGMIKDKANFEAYQPFAKNIPALLDYLNSTGKVGSAADQASRITDKTGLEYGYDFTARLGVMRKMSAYTDQDAEYTRQAMAGARTFGVDPHSLTDLLGNSARYQLGGIDKNGNSTVFGSIVAAGKESGLSRPRYAELIKGIDEIIKKSIQNGVPVRVESVASSLAYLGKAGESFKGEMGTEKLLGMNERLRSSVDLSDDYDVALYQYTKKEKESYLDWAKRMEKGFDEESFNALRAGVVRETGGDTMAGVTRLRGMFGNLNLGVTDAEKMLDLFRGVEAKKVSSSDAQKEFDKMLKEAENTPELGYLNGINTTMEKAQTAVTDRLNLILAELKEYTRNQDRNKPDIYDKYIELDKQFLKENKSLAISSYMGELTRVLNDADISVSEKKLTAGLIRQFDNAENGGRGDGYVDADKQESFFKWMDKITATISNENSTKREYDEIKSLLTSIMNNTKEIRVE